jgi:hypothetical protein
MEGAERNNTWMGTDREMVARSKRVEERRRE